MERELLNNQNLLQEFLLEPASIPQNPAAFPSDSIPNILLRSKLAPEVINPIKNKISSSSTCSDLKLFSSSVRVLEEKFSLIQEDLQRAAAEHTSLLLANEISTSSGTATPKAKRGEEDMEAILENSIRWLYTGQQ